MDTLKQVNIFKKFFEEVYYSALLEQARIGKRFLKIDFGELCKFDPDLSEIMLNTPEEGITAAVIAIEQFDLPGNGEKFELQIMNLPPSSKRLIYAKRANDINQLLTFEGVIRSKSKVLIRTVSARFECPSCGNPISVLQNDEKMKEPSRCGCGRKGKFRRLSKETTDVQKIELEELSENVKGTSQPQRLKVYLQGFLVDPKYEPKFNPGAKVKTVGILQELPIKLRNGGESVDGDHIFECKHIENIDNVEIDLNITKKERKKIDQISQRDDCIKILTDSLVPSIYGHDRIKEGILVQLAGGVRKINQDGTTKRGDIHILMIGDPGAGKSAICKGLKRSYPMQESPTAKAHLGLV